MVNSMGFFLQRAARSMTKAENQHENSFNITGYKGACQILLIGFCLYMGGGKGGAV